MWTRDAHMGSRRMMMWHETIEFVKGLNNSGYAGYRDWRLPSKEDLLTLIDYAKSQGVSRNLPEFFNRIGFSNVQPNDYWSSTTVSYFPNSARVVGLSYGGNTHYFKNRFFNVWCIRGGQ